MAARRNEGRVGANSRLQAQRISDYKARLRELTEAFSLPKELRKWVTVRYDPDSEDPTQRYRITVSGQAGRTVASLDVQAPDALFTSLERVLKDNEADLAAQLKGDLATNLMAGMTAVPGKDEE